MPLVTSTYKPKFYFRNGHISTIYSAIFRNVKGLVQDRERITLSDGDFLDLDWSYSAKKSHKLIIILHGLEGDAQRPYIKGTAKFFNINSIDAVSVNYRGCSGESNSKYRSYHSGATEDLEDVINHVLKTKDYSDIYIKGFSLGGNMLLKFLGEREVIPKQVKAAIAISVPCDLTTSSIELHKFKNIIYHQSFIRSMMKRLKEKQNKFPKCISKDEIESIKILKDFDDVYTSKAHGFKDAIDYHKKCSSLQFLKKITIPTLIINALNDSFLSPECFPVKEAKHNSNLHLEMPDYGGHVGFVDSNNIYYNESRALDFIMDVSPST
jgi:predicted alpha/beta-fold hydrolase